jgi:hypothetical protein
LSGAERHAQSRAGRLWAGAFAGALAIGGATIVVNALIYLGGPLAEVLLTTPGSVVAVALTFPLEPLYLLGLIVAVVILGVVAGMGYGAGEERLATGWPDWLHGLAFAVLLMVVSLLLVTPLVLLHRGESPVTWLVAALGEAFWWAVYGVLLGLIYPLLRTRRAAAAEPVADRDVADTAPAA